MKRIPAPAAARAACGGGDDAVTGPFSGSHQLVRTKPAAAPAARKPLRAFGPLYTVEIGTSPTVSSSAPISARASATPDGEPPRLLSPSTHRRLGRRRRLRPARRGRGITGTESVTLQWNPTPTLPPSATRAGPWRRGQRRLRSVRIYLYLWEHPPYDSSSPLPRAPDLFPPVVPGGLFLLRHQWERQLARRFTFVSTADCPRWCRRCSIRGEISGGGIRRRSRPACRPSRPPSSSISATPVVPLRDIASPASAIASSVDS